MSDPYAEIPENRPAQRESLGPVTRLTAPLYQAVIWILGATLVVGVVGWLLLALSGKRMPEGLGVILGTVAGALVGLVSDKVGSNGK